MREILFRGKDIAGNWYAGKIAVVKEDMHNGAGTIKAGSYISNEYGMPFAYQVRPETIGQFTGLVDKHGRKIFEGDIVVTCPSPLSISDGGDISKRLVVDSWVFTDMCYSAMCRKSSKREKFYKIIGNIHEEEQPCTSATVE